MKTKKLFTVLAVLSTQAMLAAFSVNALAQSSSDENVLKRSPGTDQIEIVKDIYSLKFDERSQKIMEIDNTYVKPPFVKPLNLDRIKKQPCDICDQIELMELDNKIQKLGYIKMDDLDASRSIANVDKPAVVENEKIVEETKEELKEELIVDTNQDLKSDEDQVEILSEKEKQAIFEQMANQALADEKNEVQKSEVNVVLNDNANESSSNSFEKAAENNADIYKEALEKKEETQNIKEESEITEKVEEIKQDAQELKDVAQADPTELDKEVIKDGIENAEEVVEDLNKEVESAQEDSEKVKELNQKLEETQKLLEEAKTALKEKEVQNNIVKSKYTNLEKAYCEQKDQISDLTGQFDELSNNVQGSLQQLFMAQQMNYAFNNPFMTIPGYTNFNGSNSMGLDYGYEMARLNSLFRADSLGGITNNYYNVGGNYYAGNYSQPNFTSTMNPMNGLNGMNNFNGYNAMNPYGGYYNTPYSFDFNAVTDGVRFGQMEYQNFGNGSTGFVDPYLYNRGPSSLYNGHGTSVNPYMNNMWNNTVPMNMNI